MTTPQTPEDALKNTKGCMKIGCLGFLGIVAVVVAISFIGSWVGSGDSDPYTPTAQHAEKSCEDNIGQQLKTPSTAEFVNVTSSSTGPNEWSVFGSVDSENSFGATVRTDWACAATYVASTESYSTNSWLLD